MKEEQQNLERSKQPKERSLAQLKANLEAMQATKEGLESELHQDLLATLSVQVSFKLKPKKLLLNDVFLKVSIAIKIST